MDIIQREGNYPGIPSGSSEILGVEFSGHIVALGPKTSLGWQTGDEVLGLADGVSIDTKFLVHSLAKTQY
jgi:NADPH:quinone reductase-like Zn-dependent oxidoreductase